jgi:hypothetical protein
MKRFVMLVACALACAAPPPPQPVARVEIRAPSASAATQLPEIPSDVPSAYALGWTWWRDGRKSEALRAFRVAIAALELHGDEAHHQKRPLHAERATLTFPTSDGDHVATLTEGGLLVADAKKRAFDAFVAMPNAYQVDVVGTDFVAVTRPDEVALFDVAHASIVERVAMQNAGMRRGKSKFVVQGSDQGVRVDVWDPARREKIRTLHDPKLEYAAFVELALDDRVVVATGQTVDVWDVATGEKLLDFTGVPALPNVPGFSGDGKYIAYGAVDFDKSPIVGTTSLFDRKTHTVIATSHASHYPSGFAFHDKWLAVGDLRRACLLAVPRMTQLACSSEIRPSAGVDDDLQETTPTFIDSGRELVLTTGDGSTMIVRPPTMTPIWRGRAKLTIGSDGATYLVDSDENGEVYAIGADGLPTRISALPVEPTRSIESCRVGSWMFPADAC